MCTQDISAHKALQSHVNLSLGRLPHPSWSCRPGRPRGRWIDQIRNDTSKTPADLWPRDTGPWTWSSWTSDATAHAGYAMMMMMIQRGEVSNNLPLMSVWLTRPHKPVTR